jgi:hypothetical protein
VQTVIVADPLYSRESYVDHHNKSVSNGFRSLPNGSAVLPASAHATQCNAAILHGVSCERFHRLLVILAARH